MPAQGEELQPEAREHARLFRRCLPLRMKVDQVRRLLGGLREGTVCLDIGADNPTASHHLRRLGGQWHSVAASPAGTEALRNVVKDNVHEFKDGALPFEAKTFDAVVVIDQLQRVRDDEAFVAECHRVLKADGKLFVDTARAKPWSLLRLWRAAWGVSPQTRGFGRPGYTESELFAVLKNGFDVHEVRTYSRFFVELTDAVVQFAERRVRSRPDADLYGLLRLYSLARIFYFLASQLDMLLFFTRGHRCIAMAKRRAWRPRTAPVLVDGRTIPEAVLSRASD